VGFSLYAVTGRFGIRTTCNGVPRTDSPPALRRASRRTPTKTSSAPFRATSDGNGNWATSTQYKPFGQEYASQGSSGPLKYTGQQADPATGLYYLYRRFYDPDLGRFLSQDVILGHLTVPQSLARYTYVVNNPIRYVDPTGEDWWNPWSWGADLGNAIASAGAAVGDWWSSSVWDKLDMAMTVLGFVPGLDVISDAYFLGRALIDVVQGGGSWADVAMNAAFLLAPAVGGAYFRAAKTAFNAADGLGDAGKAARRGSNAAETAQDLRKADGVGDSIDPRGPRPKYGKASDDHVQPRHHDTTKYPDKSKFASGEGGQRFADEVYDNPSVRVAQQMRDRRFVYVVEDMGRNVGSRSGVPTRSGTVITDLNGNVITQFPGSPSWWKW
jgi:RHS repeat-associated protein